MRYTTGKILKLNWENNIVTALLQNEKKYYILWGKSEEPKINIERDFLATHCIISENGDITLDFISNHNTLFTIMLLNNYTEYETAARLIQTLLGDNNGT